MFVISAEVPSSSSVIMLSNSDSRQWVTMVLPPGPGPLLSHAEYTPEIDNMLSVMAVSTYLGTVSLSRFGYISSTFLVYF